MAQREVICLVDKEKTETKKKEESVRERGIKERRERVSE